MMHRLFFANYLRSPVDKVRSYIACSIVKDIPIKNPAWQDELAATAKQKGYSSPYWVKHDHIEPFKKAGYDIDIKSDEVPVQVIKTKHKEESQAVDDESDTKDEVIDYYNIEQTTNPSIFDDKWLKLSRFVFHKNYIPVDLHGQQFEKDIKLIMRFYLLKRSIKSHLMQWVCEDQIQYFPRARPKEGAQPLRIPGLSKGYYHISEFQNADTGNPIARWLIHKKHQAYSGVTGKPYAQHCQAKLQKIARKRGYKYRHWITASQLSKFVPPLKLRANQKGVSLKMTDAKTGKQTQVIAYNQKQLVQPRIVTVHINRIIGKTRFKRGNNTVVVSNVQDATDDEIKDALISYGHIYQICRLRLAFVLVNFISDASAKEVIEKCQGMTIGKAQGVTFAAPRKENEKVCRDMLRTGICKVKERCPYVHDEDVVNEIRRKQEMVRSEILFNRRGGRRTDDGNTQSDGSNFRDESRQSWGGRARETSSWNRGSGWGRGGSMASPESGWGQSAPNAGRATPGWNRGRGWSRGSMTSPEGGWGQSDPNAGRATPGWNRGGGWSRGSTASPEGGWGQSTPSRGWGQAAPSANRGWGQSAPSANRGWGQAAPSAGRGSGWR